MARGPDLSYDPVDPVAASQTASGYRGPADAATLPDLKKIKTIIAEKAALTTDD
jgi:hypothetical protein